jgi:hypothetical protein
VEYSIVTQTTQAGTLTRRKEFPCMVGMTTLEVGAPLGYVNPRTALVASEGYDVLVLQIYLRSQWLDDERGI